MRTKQRHAGYLCIDHRNTPGMPARLLAAMGPEAISAPAGQRLEVKIFTCSHCQRQLIENPERKRARAYCPSCDHYICDLCEGQRLKTGCMPIAKVFDVLQERVARGKPLVLYDYAGRPLVAA